jgi:5-methylcytosine-specific restriction endonuclease McrA
VDKDRDWKQRFYKSKPWRLMRAFIIDRDKGVCQKCGELIIGIPEVDHEIELTRENYQDPAISLNPELLRTMHHECHDERHSRFGGITKETIVDDDLNIDYARR